MPKLLVLFHPRDPDVVALAQAVVEGARGVRFAEVDLRRLGMPDAPEPANDGVGRAHRALERVDDIAAYDGLILVLPAARDAAATLTETLGVFGGSLANKVGSVVTAAGGEEEGRTAALWSALVPMADRGMILVPAPFANTVEPAAESARRVGKRVADVVGWVAHARSHHHHEPHHHDHHSHHHA